jgi:hypothetical protein
MRRGRARGLQFVKLIEQLNVYRVYPIRRV